MGKPADEIGSGITKRKRFPDHVQHLSELYWWENPSVWLLDLERDLLKERRGPGGRDGEPYSDRNWYVSEMLKYVALIRSTVSEGKPKAVISPTFKLGYLLREMELKFSWAPAALRGLNHSQGSKKGGAARAAQRHPLKTPEVLRAAVEAELQVRPGKMRAYAEVARKRGVGVRTVERAMNGKKLPPIAPTGEFW